MGENERERIKFKIVISYDEKCKKAREESKKAGTIRSFITIKVTPKDTKKKVVENVLIYALNWMLTGDPEALERYVKELKKMPVGIV